MRHSLGVRHGLDVRHGLSACCGLGACSGLGLGVFLVRNMYLDRVGWVALRKVLRWF